MSATDKNMGRILPTGNTGRGGVRPPTSGSLPTREDPFIEWLIDIYYPFDMTFDPAPPVDLDRLALRWKARDHWDDVSDEDAINCIREEARA